MVIIFLFYNISKSNLFLVVSCCWEPPYLRALSVLFESICMVNFFCMTKLTIKNDMFEVKLEKQSKIILFSAFHILLKCLKPIISYKTQKLLIDTRKKIFSNTLNFSIKCRGHNCLKFSFGRSITSTIKTICSIIKAFSVQNLENLFFLQEIHPSFTSS